MKRLSVYFVLLMALGLVIVPTQGFAVSDPKASPNEAVYQPELTDTVDESGVAAETEKSDHAAHTEKKEGGLPQLNISTYPSQIFWLFVMFVVLYVTFSKSILPTIGNVVDNRDNHIKGNINDAEALKNRALAIQADYEKSLEAAKFNASKAVQDVEIAAKKKLADQIDAFRKKADSEIAVAEKNVLAAKSKAMVNITSVVTEVASMAAEKISGVSTDRQNAQNIVENIASKAKAA